GLAPRRYADAAQNSQASGNSHSTNTSGLASGCSRTRWTAARLVRAMAASVELAQVHAGVELAHLRLVAVEHQRRAALGEQAAVLADAPLVGLAPARVRNLRIHVGIKAVLLRRRQVPRGAGHLLDEADLDQRLAALEAVFPGHHQAQRRAVLVRQHLTIETEGQQRQRVLRLVEAQSFDVGP